MYTRVYFNMWGGTLNIWTDSSHNTNGSRLSYTEDMPTPLKCFTFKQEKLNLEQLVVTVTLFKILMLMSYLGHAGMSGIMCDMCAADDLMNNPARMAQIHIIYRESHPVLLWPTSTLCCTFNMTKISCCLPLQSFFGFLSQTSEGQSAQTVMICPLSILFLTPSNMNGELLLDRLGLQGLQVSHTCHSSVPAAYQHPAAGS